MGDSERRAGASAVIIDEITELPDGSDGEPEWTNPALVAPNLAIGDAVEIRLVQDMLRLHGEIARAMEASARCDLPEAARKQLQLAADLMGDLKATIKALVAYRGELLPKVKINPAVIVGQMAKRQALLTPAAGTAQEELALRIDDLCWDWDRVIARFKQQREDVGRALEDAAYDWRWRAAGLPVATMKDLHAWRELEVLALHHRVSVARDWSRIVASDVRARVVYGAPSAQKELARTEPRRGVRHQLAKGVH